MLTLCCFISKIDISDCIALIGVLLTGLFSFLIWRTTKKIGDRQNDLQERQNKIALNQIYRDLYICIKDIYRICNLFYYDLSMGIIAIVDDKERNYYQSRIDDFKRVRKEFENHSIDFELQLSNYSMLTYRIDNLLLSMDWAYSVIQSIQMPSYIKDDYEKTNVIKRMLETINKEKSNFYLKENTDVKAITNEEYRGILKEMSELLNNSTWDISDYSNKTDEDIIKYLSEQLCKITDNINIENDCKIIVSIRDRIFTQDNILEYVKNKCSL